MYLFFRKPWLHHGSWLMESGGGVGKGEEGVYRYYGKFGSRGDGEGRG